MAYRQAAVALHLFREQLGILANPEDHPELWQDFLYEAGERIREYEEGGEA